MDEPQTATTRTTLNQRFGSGFIVTLGVLAAIVLGIALGSLATILVCIILALFIALGLDPVVRALERRGVKRVWGIAIVFAVFLIVVIIGAVFLLPAVITQLVEFTVAIPASLEEIEATAWFQGLDPAVAGVLTAATNQLALFFSDPANIVALFGGLLAFGVGVVNAVSAGIIIVVLTMYFLGSLTSMKQALYKLTAAHHRPTVESLTEQITGSIGSFVLGAVILASCNAAVVTVIHLVLGLPYPALMGLLAFLITLVPVIGSVLYWVFGTVVALFTSPTAALLFAILYLIYMQLEAYVVTPRVMSRATAIPGVLVIIGALVGGTLLGLLGALVAIPITAAILLIIRDVIIPRQNSKLTA